MVPIELVDVPRVEQPKKVEVAPPPPPPAPKPKPQNITAPKLLSKPVLETSPLPPTGNTKEEIKEKPVEQPPQLASLPDNAGAAKAGWNAGSKAAEAEGSAAGAGNLFGKGDVGVVGGSGVAGGGGGTGTSGLGRGAKGDGTGGGAGSGEALSGLARPLGGYQVKPRYPESAQRAGAQGVTMLRVRVLENGRVAKSSSISPPVFAISIWPRWTRSRNGSSSRRAEAKKRSSVWVMLPVKFELH